MSKPVPAPPHYNIDGNGRGEKVCTRSPLLNVMIWGWKGAGGLKSGAGF